MQESGFNTIKMEKMQLIFKANCKKFREQIEGIKYFSLDWIIGSTNDQSSNLDHTGVSHKEALTNYKSVKIRKNFSI